MPVGISFYTFQSLAYVIDVYRGDIEVQKHVGIYALFISFFPQLVAGPIERSHNLMPQFLEEHHFDYQNASDGIRMMAVGFFKKIVVADCLSKYVNFVYNDLPNHTGFSLILATVLFAFQIYCDFSGYSDIAIGAARMLGFRLMKNFDSPYLAHSIKEFWRRWHISLSTWFSDYVYIPLGGQSRQAPALLFQPVCDVPRQRTLAWCKLDVRRLGRAARVLSHHRCPARNRAQAPRTRPRARDNGFPRRCGHRSDLYAGDHRLGVFPREFHSGCAVRISALL